MKKMHDLTKIINGIDLDSIIEDCISSVYANGTSDIGVIEKLSYFKLYQPKFFEKYEQTILMKMGLFYKSVTPQSLEDCVFNIYREQIKSDYNATFTPIQVEIIDRIKKQQFFSFSSPTSTGKSFVFRYLINMYSNDIVIVVPSRALINEYYNLVLELVDIKVVNVLTFVDLINTKRCKRNIFIVTPERTKDLFILKDRLNVDLFMFDEAQLSNDSSVRGLYYDSVIRRVVKAFDKSKFVFAYPFIDNPEVQYKKNNIRYTEEDYELFKQRNVGQIFFSRCENGFRNFSLESNSRFYYDTDFDPLEKVISEEGTALIYCSKASIYSKEIFKKYHKYINMCQSLPLDDETRGLIEKLRAYIGASQLGKGDYASSLIEYLKRGIVVHHGSLPLEGRKIIEEFTRKGYCRLCFATSTLDQGINMPFDLVWIERFEPSKPLNVKNLIGRAGRSTKNNTIFDLGQIVIEDTKKSGLRSVLKNETHLSEVSQLDMETDSNDDYREYKEAIKNDEFSEEYNMTNAEVERVSSNRSCSIVEKILDALFFEGEIQIASMVESKMSADVIHVYDLFSELFTCYLGRYLTEAEDRIVKTAIKILMWKIKGKTFSQIVWNRYSYAARTYERREIQADQTKPEYFRNMEARGLPARWISQYQPIPNKKITSLSITYNTLAFAVDYDRVVFDTYDYLDKLIGFRFGDAYYAAFSLYGEKYQDMRAAKMANYIRYGTNDNKEIMMLRYGFDFEDFEWLSPIIKSISEEEIMFANVTSLSEEQTRKIERYL